MNGNEFLRRLRRLGKARGVSIIYETGRGTGKGSHGMVWFGDQWTTLKDPRKEIGPGLLNSMCRGLGIDRKDI